eukprot:UC1_evm4s83
MSNYLLVALLLLFFLSAEVTAAAVAATATLNITAATICVSSGSEGTRAVNYAKVLSDEIFKRARVRWPVINASSLSTLAAAADMTTILLDMAPLGHDEGYRITTATTTESPTPATSYATATNISSSPSTAVSVTGNDERGLLFGVGRLLRLVTAEYSEGYKIGPRSNVTVPAGVSLRSHPRYALRGHQLGYRPKTNAYDAWTVSQYRLYALDLAFFGTNMIELIPPRTDDVPFSPMFPAAPQDTLNAISAELDALGLQLGLWYPMMEKNYSDPHTLAKANAEWHSIFGGLKRCDMVQVPAGDPGSHAPQTLFDVVVLMAAVARSYFPKVAIWLGPQEWAPDRMREWETLVAQPRAQSLLAGIVYGPHTAQNLTQFGAREPQSMKLRLYPDITHSLTTQFPVPDWDRALAITQSRESINPRPRQMAHVAALHLGAVERIVGFSSYSEGANDDINKFVWSAAAWGPDEEARNVPRKNTENNNNKNDDKTPQENNNVVTEAMTDYARMFLSARWADALSSVIFGLEQAWEGPVVTNAHIASTMATIRAFEADMRPTEASNWRLQQLRYRAYYDVHVQLRARREAAADAAALAKLRSANKTGTPVQVAIEDAMRLLPGSMPLSSAAAAAVSPGVDAHFVAANVSGVTELEAYVCVREMAAALFASAGMQLSVARYFAEYTVRGANLDTLELPISNAPYIRQVLGAAASAQTSAQAWSLLAHLLAWNTSWTGSQHATVTTAMATKNQSWHDGGGSRRGNAEADGNGEADAADAATFYYDDLGVPDQQPHLVLPLPWASDPDYYTNPLCARAIAHDVHWADGETQRAQKPVLDSLPVPWQTYVATFYNAPLRMRYTLPADAAGTTWRIEAVYPAPNVYSTMARGVAAVTAKAVGYTPPPQLRLTANGHVVHDFVDPPKPTRRMGWDIPAAALSVKAGGGGGGGGASANRLLLLEWVAPANAGGSGVGCRVAEVLLYQVKK